MRPQSPTWLSLRSGDACLFWSDQIVVCILGEKKKGGDLKRLCWEVVLSVCRGRQKCRPPASRLPASPPPCSQPGSMCNNAHSRGPGTQGCIDPGVPGLPCTPASEAPGLGKGEEALAHSPPEPTRERPRDSEWIRRGQRECAGLPKSCMMHPISKTRGGRAVVYERQQHLSILTPCETSA